MSPSMNSILSAIGERFSRRPVIRLSNTRTRSPRLRRASAMCEPMNPAPPVTRYNSLFPTLVFPSFGLGSVGNGTQIYLFHNFIFHMAYEICHMKYEIWHMVGVIETLVLITIRSPAALQP